MQTIIVDTFETDIVRTYLSWTLQVHKMNLVPRGLADFFWDTGLRYTLEHKTAAQAVSESGQRLDKQLAKHIQNARKILQEVWCGVW